MTDTEQSYETVILPAHATTVAASTIHALLLKADGNALQIDASKVTRLGALIVQLILAAENRWKENSHPFEIKSPTSAFLETGKRLGLAHLLTPDSEAEFT